MKNIRYIIIFILGAGLLFNSCNDILDVNDDPNNPKYVPANSLLPVVLFYGSQTVYDHALYGAFLSQALTTGGRSQSSSYPYEGGWDFMNITRHPQWRRHYIDIGANSNTLLSLSAEKNLKNYELVTRTIRLMSTMLTTDMFGAMPRSDAYKSSAPKYDDQKDIYNWMYSEVDELLAHYNDPAWINAETNIPMGESIDRIYAGDMEKWKRFTYALKARLYLRKLPNWEPTPEMCNIIINACDSALVNWTEPLYKYPTGSTPEKNCPWGPTQPKVNSWESYPNRLDNAIPTKYFMKTVLGLNDAGLQSVDPRLPKIMQRRAGPKDSDDTGLKYRFVEANFGIPSTYSVTNYPNLYQTDAGAPAELTRANGYIALMLTEELYLIKAEALYWTKSGDVTKKQARDLTIDAVTENLKRQGVVTFQINSFLKNSTYFPDLSTFNIGHIMRHKYVCMYLQPEMWTDMRRYKYSNNVNNNIYDGSIIYPDLQRPFNLLESVWGGNNDWVQRINYDPQTEPVYNKPELVRLGAFENPNWLKKPMIWAE